MRTTPLLLALLIACNNTPRKPDITTKVSAIDSAIKQFHINLDTIGHRIRLGGEALKLRLLIDSLRVEYYKTNKDILRKQVNELIPKYNNIIDSLDKYR